VEAFKVELVKAEAAGAEATKTETVKPEPPPIPGKLLVMSPADRAWNGGEAGAEPEAAAGEASSGKRRKSAMAAVVARGTMAGAVGGALATVGAGHMKAEIHRSRITARSKPRWRGSMPTSRR
jgi:hypothetical protein